MLLSVVLSKSYVQLIKVDKMLLNERSKSEAIKMLNDKHLLRRMLVMKKVAKFQLIAELFWNIKRS
jgi:hypothetical protein